jgi:hypothetical protein
VLTARYGALGHEFAFDLPSAAVASFVERALAPMRVPGSPSAWWRVVDHGPDRPVRFDIVTGSGATYHVEREDDLPILLLWYVNRTVCFETPGRLMIHAGAVARDSRAVLLPAVAESGKSTLTAGLVRAGLDYLSDEAGALTADGLVDPYPKSIALDPGSWPLLPDLEPDLPGELGAYGARQWHIDPNTIRAGAVAGRSTPVLVVSPAYTTGVRTSLDRVSPAEAVRLLAQESFNLRHWGKRGLELLAGIARRAPCYRLRYSSLDAAVDAVLGLVDDHS